MIARRPDFLDVLDRPTTDHRPALLDVDRTVRHADLTDRVRKTAFALTRHGVRPGDRVAVILGNRVEAVELYFACAATGALWVGVNPNAPRAERDRQLGLVTPRLTIVDGQPVTVEAAKTVGLPELYADDGRADLGDRPALDTPCAIAFTSGTTSLPKAVVHSRAAVSLAATAHAHNGIRRDDRVGVILPLSIHNLLVAGALPALIGGASLVAVARMNAHGVARACRDHELTLLSALVPATVYDLTHDDDVSADALSSLRYAGTGAAGLAEELRDRFEAKFGIALRGSYGMTEAPGPIAVEQEGVAHREGSSGVALPHVTITTNGGELVVSPATSGPFAGQFRPPAGRWGRDGLTPWPDDAVLRSGDFGCVGRAGDVFVASRRGGVIVRGGVNIEVGEVEAVLSEIPGVRGVAVVGGADDRLGERVVAYVEMQSGAVGGPAELREQARLLLSHGKTPDEFVVMTSLPRNAMGKVQRSELPAP